MNAIESLPASLRRYLQAYAARHRGQNLVRRLGLALFVFVVSATLACLADRLLALSPLSRLTLLILCGCFAFGLLVPALRAWLRGTPDWYAIALSVERRHPLCNERLATVISRMLGPERDRGSETMMQSVAVGLADDVRAYSVRQLLPARRVAPPWITLGIFAAIMAGLWMIPSLDMPRLALRFVRPFGNLRPATTTRLLVSPGDTDLVESQPLQVQVRARRLGDHPLILHLRRPGGDWFTLNMSQDADGTFASTLGQIDQDLDYFVSGGDAISDLYHVRILRKPVVTEYKIHYDYPAATALPPTTVRNTDGLVEAPAGTRVTIRIHSSEPLAAATLTFGTQALAMTSTGDPTIRQATIAVTKNESYEIGLSSTRGMVGAVARKLAIKVIPDRAPVVRLLSPRDDQWLKPAAKLPLIYDAGDDFALATLDIQTHIVPLGIRSEADEAEDDDGLHLDHDFPLRIIGNQRRQVGECRLDLGALELSVGDIVTLRLRAVDGAGQIGLSKPIHLIIAPSSVSHRQRELPKALAATADLMRQWNQAHEVNDKEALAQQVRSAVLRAIYECQTSSDAAGIIRLADAAERILTSTGGDQAATAGADLSKQFTLLSHAAEAKNLLLDLNDLTVLRSKLRSSVKPTVQQAQRDVDSLQKQVDRQLAALKLDPHAPDQQRLEKLAGYWDRTDRSEIDFAQAANAWFDALLHGRNPGTLSERLDTAALAETIRPDGDLLWARDLERASIAAASFQKFNPADGPPPAAARLAAAIAVLQHEHHIRREEPTTLTPRTESDEVVQARQQLADWSSSIPESAQTPAGQLEALTLHASAETVLRNLSNTLAIDRALAGEVTPAAERSARIEFAAAQTAREMDLVQALDALVLQQQAIGNQLEQAASVSSPANGLADQQARLVESLMRAVKNAGRPGEGTRLAAARKVLAMDDILASLVQLARQPELARESANDLDQDTLELTQDLAILRRYLGSAAPVVQTIEHQLLPLANTLAESAANEMPMPPDVQAIESAVKAVRPLLSGATESIVSSDALTAAQFHAHQAELMLAKDPVEYGPTLGQISAALAGLRKAWNQAIHRAALARAVRLPALARAIWEEPPTPNGMELPIAGADLNPPPPAGFENAIKAYFEAIRATHRQTSPTP